MTDATVVLPATTNSSLRPIRGWPLGVYGLLAIWLCGVQLCLRLHLMGNSQVNLESLVTASFLAPIALVAMSRIDLMHRLRFFLFVLALKVVLNLASEFLVALNNPLGLFPKLPLYELAKTSIRDVRDFAIAISIGHAISSVTMTYVTSQSLSYPRALQARIVDWLYFITFVGLTFLPQWPEPRLTYNANKEIVFSLKRGGFGQSDLFEMVLQLSLCLGAALTGHFWLTRCRDWRLMVLMAALITAQVILCTTFAHFEFMGNTPYSVFFGVFAFAALITTPFWILLRIAGYHVVSTRSPLLAHRNKVNDSAASLNP